MVGRGSDRIVRLHRKGSVDSPSRLSFGLISTCRGLLDQLFKAVPGRLGITITSSRRRRVGVSLFVIWFILLESLQDGVLGVIRQERHQPIPSSLQYHPGFGPRDPIRPLLSGTSQLKNRKATTTIKRPLASPNRNPRVRSSAPILESRIMSEIRTVTMETKIRVPTNTPATTTTVATVSLLK